MSDKLLFWAEKATEYKEENKRLKQRINLLQIAGDEAIKQRNEALRELDEARAENVRLEEREKLGIAHSETYKMLCERTRELEEARAEVEGLREALEHIIEIVARLAIVDPGSKGFCKRIYDEAEQALEGGS